MSINGIISPATIRCFQHGKLYTIKRLIHVLIQFIPHYEKAHAMLWKMKIQKESIKIVFDKINDENFTFQKIVRVMITAASPPLRCGCQQLNGLKNE
ncbi:CLUMA_CG003890, isoform A [Clunio marinus]|uniref:CLUMA_CG003890, isoform A n=1 Tax=Clunio marinus TaxID=568069 RepID=A0A1J1HQ40_9DIPT|nr:CLUMA_CG003890, isoform A [Clunio marinus]